MSKKHCFPLLETIHGPKDVHDLSEDQLKQLSEELRCFLIDTVSQIGGHFGSNLGVVELTVALHYIFNVEKDRIIWDVGHQAYAHKALTNRKERLHTIRQKGGLAPFPKREESISDAFGVGHSSTSISAATGMALGQLDKKRRSKVVAVIGDGALTGGMSYEALDHAGDVGADILVIVNDNRMSISPNVGAMTKYLTRLISSPEYTNIRIKGQRFLRKFPSLSEAARRVEKHAKGMVMPSTIFEEMGFDYFGPVDGNDAEALASILKNLKRIHGPRLLHVVTKKGKGCIHAENDALKLHAVTSFDPKTGKKNGTTKKSQTFTDIFSNWIVKKTHEDSRLHVITPAMKEGSGLVELHKKYPNQFHDVGIAEQHAVTLAAGLACVGKKPIVAIYSTFLQRAYDQLIHDVAIQNLDVLFAIDRAGLVGPDGPTHAGSFDLSFMRCVPNMMILAPADAQECANMLSFGFDHKGPVAVRYPRSEAKNLSSTTAPIEQGKASIVREGKDVAILSFGALLERCIAVGERINATVVNMRFVKPLDEALIQELAKEHTKFVTVEDNAVVGGAGSAVNECVMKGDLGVHVQNLGIPDAFLEHGTRDELLSIAGLDEDSIFERIGL